MNERMSILGRSRETHKVVTRVHFARIERNTFHLQIPLTRLIVKEDNNSKSFTLASLFTKQKTVMILMIPNVHRTFSIRENFLKNFIMNIRRRVLPHHVRNGRVVGSNQKRGWLILYRFSQYSGQCNRLHEPLNSISLLHPQQKRINRALANKVKTVDLQSGNEFVSIDFLYSKLGNATPSPC